jgi:pimeloyl-ACP methyl ester carboxylesterase
MSSIDEGEFVDVDGVLHWLALRGADTANPALLLLGGPGASFAGVAPFFESWERDFTLVHWDQPGAGFTFARSGAEPESIAALAIAAARVAEIARSKLGRSKLGVLACSGGTMVGLHLLRERPDLVSAYVGGGQFVNWARQDAVSYALLLERAKAAGNAAMLAELAAIGPPPYADSATDAVKSKYAGAPTAREAAAFAELMGFAGAALGGAPAGARYLAPDLRWPEPLLRSFAAYSALRPELVGFDARRLGTTFSVPMYFIQGVDDLFTVTSEVERYAAELAAPHAEVLHVADAGHSAVLIREETRALLARHVRPKLV